jgi:hypothetical protein
MEKWSTKKGKNINKIKHKFHIYIGPKNFISYWASWKAMVHDKLWKLLELGQSITY